MFDLMFDLDSEEIVSPLCNTDSGPVMAIVLPTPAGPVLYGNGTFLNRGPVASLVRIGTALGFEVIDCTSTPPVAQPVRWPPELS